LPSNDPEYQKRYIKQHYQDNKQYYKDKRKARQKALRPKLIAFTNRYKTFCGCIDCGYKDNPVALQFDHVRGLKKDNVSSLVSQCFSMQVIKEEIRKCEVRCANCHSIVTHSRRSSS